MKKNKIYKPILLISFIGLFFLNCQHKSKSKEDRKISYERLKTSKINFMIENAELEIDEEKLFWPLYNNYEDAVNSSQWKISKKLKKYLSNKFEGISEEDAFVILSGLDSLRKLEYELNYKLYKDLKIFLTDKKILKLHVAEQTFIKKTIRKWSKNKN